MTAFFEARDIHKTFPGPPVLNVLCGACFQVSQGQSVAIMGKSGEGKSTLLHIFGGLDRNFSGTLLLQGENTASYAASLLRSKYFGFIFQAYHLLEDFTVLENVMMPLHIARQKVGVKKRAQEMLFEVGLEGKETLLAKYLSGGEKQRVAIARALVNDPEIILADEPTGNLDKTHSMEIQTLLLESVKKFKKTLIVVTHDESFAASCEHTFFLQDGILK